MALYKIDVCYCLYKYLFTAMRMSPAIAESRRPCTVEISKSFEICSVLVFYFHYCLPCDFPFTFPLY